MGPARTPTVRLGGERPYRQVVGEVLHQMAEAAHSDHCPMCGRVGAHEHTNLETTIYSNGVKFGMAMATKRHPNEGKLMF